MPHFEVFVVCISLLCNLALDSVSNILLLVGRLSITACPKDTI